MGTSSDLWVSHQGKVYQAHSSYDGHLTTAGSLLARTAAQVGLARLREAFAACEVSVAPEFVEEILPSRLDFVKALSAYQEAAIARGRSPLVEDQQEEAIMWEYPYTGVVTLFARSLESDAGWMEPEQSLYQMDLDKGTLRLCYDEDFSCTLDIAALEGVSEKAIEDFFVVLEEVWGLGEPADVARPRVEAAKEIMLASCFVPETGTPGALVLSPRPVVFPELPPLDAPMNSCTITRGFFEFAEAACVLRHGMFALGMQHSVYEALRESTGFFSDENGFGYSVIDWLPETAPGVCLSSRWREAVNAFGHPVSSVSGAVFGFPGDDEEEGGLFGTLNGKKQLAQVRKSWNAPIAPAMPVMDEVICTDEALAAKLPGLMKDPLDIARLRLLQMCMPRASLSPLVDASTTLPFSPEKHELVAALIHDFWHFRFAVDPDGAARWAHENRDSVWMGEVLAASPVPSRRWLVALQALGESRLSASGVFSPKF